MGRYASWEDVVNRYPLLNRRKGGADEVNSSFVVFAENELDGRLGGCFTVPFSSNNLTAKDLTIELTALKSNLWKEKDRERRVKDLDARIERLKNGEELMAVTSGPPLSADQSGVFSTTKNYHSTFGLVDVLDQGTDVDQLEDEIDERS